MVIAAVNDELMGETIFFAADNIINLVRELKSEQKKELYFFDFAKHIKVLNGNDLYAIYRSQSPHVLILYEPTSYKRLARTVHSLHRLIFFQAWPPFKIEVAHQVVSGARSQPVRLASMISQPCDIVRVGRPVVKQGSFHLSHVPEYYVRVGPA